MPARVADVPKQVQAPGVLAEVGPAMVVGLAARPHRRDVASGTSSDSHGCLAKRRPAVGFPTGNRLCRPGH